jgi:SWIM zinc finger
MSNNAFLINPNSLTDHFSDATYQRGLAVYHGQHVLECTIASGAQNEWFIDGLVLGSKYDNYTVEVALETNAHGSITYFEGTCTCPVGVDCKHCLAVTLKAAYKAGVSGQPRANAPPLPTQEEQQRLKEQQARQALEQEQRAAQHKVTQWLDLFGDAQAAPDASDTPDSAADKSNENTMVYALSAKHLDHYEVLNLTVGVAKRLRNGNWSKLKALPYYNRDSTKPTDEDIQRLIKSMSSAHYYYSNHSEHQCVLAGSTGVLALQLAASGGHLFFCEQERTLCAAVQTGAPRPMAWKWNEVTSLKSTEPSWALSPDRSQAQVHERWYFNTPPMYIDIDSGEYGMLEMPGVSSEHLALLIKAPPIPQSAFAKHETSFLRRLAGLPLPPVMHPPQVLQGITPTARLHIAAVAAKDVPRFGPLMASLRFDYGAIAHFTQSMANPIVVEKDAALSGPAAAPRERWLLHRDLPFEQSSVSRLIALGLAGNAQGNFTLAFTSAQLPQWLEWADNDYAPLRALGFALSIEPHLQDWIRRADDLQVQLAGQGAVDLAGGDDSQSPQYFAHAPDTAGAAANRSAPQCACARQQRASRWR